MLPWFAYKDTINTADAKLFTNGVPSKDIWTVRFLMSIVYNSFIVFIMGGVYLVANKH